MTKFITVVLALSIVVGISLISSLIFMWAWNDVAPVYWAQAPKLSLYNALCTMVLLSMTRTGIPEIGKKKK